MIIGKTLQALTLAGSQAANLHVMHYAILIGFGQSETEITTAPKPITTMLCSSSDGVASNVNCWISLTGFTAPCRKRTSYLAVAVLESDLILIIFGESISNRRGKI